MIFPSFICTIYDGSLPMSRGHLRLGDGCIALLLGVVLAKVARKKRLFDLTLTNRHRLAYAIALVRASLPICP